MASTSQKIRRQKKKKKKTGVPPKRPPTAFFHRASRQAAPRSRFVRTLGALMVLQREPGGASRWRGPGGRGRQMNGRNPKKGPKRNSILAWCLLSWGSWVSVWLNIDEMGFPFRVPKGDAVLAWCLFSCGFALW